MTVSAPTELWRLGALELADLVRSKRASSHEIVEAHLDRIEAMEPQINAVPVVLVEQARQAAMAADRAVASGKASPRLLGVPFVVKSNIDVAGTPTTQGLQAFSNAFPKEDAPIVERMKAAGAILLGRTNMPNIAVRWHCESELYGTTRNPWNSARTAGGSSAAVAAALATGMTPLGLGNDGLGSLRHPAQCCGVTALKPTLGRIPESSTVPGAEINPIGTQLLSVNGPMARTVADLRAAYEVIAGFTWRDPWSVPVPVDCPRDGRAVRVAVVVDPCGQGTDRQVRDGVTKAASALGRAGYDVEEGEPPSLELAAKTCLAMLNTPDLRAVWAMTAGMLPADTREFLTQFYAAAGDPDPVGTARAFATRHSLVKAWGEFQQRYALILAPVSTEPPFRAGTDISERRVAEEIHSMRMVTAVNALGLPAVAVPVGIADGLPQAVQIIGARFREDLCLDAAAALEHELGVLTPIDPVTLDGAPRH